MQYGNESWGIATLADLVSIKTGKLNSNAAVENGAYPFFTCSRETYKVDTYSFDCEAVLLAGNNANGVYPVKYYKGRFDAYQRTYVIRSVDEHVLNNRYLFYALQLELDLLQSLSTGSATKFLTLTILNALKVRVPSLSDQNRIVSILGAYDDLIENNTRRIEILEEMARRLYEEWFVQFRFPGHEGVEFKESELGLIPDGWDLTTVAETFEILGGGTPSKSEPAYWEGGQINWYSPTDLTRSGTAFMDESGTKITDIGLSRSSAKIFPPYSVMLTSRATIGVVAINTTPATTNQGFITCIPNKRFPLYLLFHWIKNNVDRFISLGTGATFKEITKGVFKGIELVVPPAALVNDFQQKVAPLMDMILRLQRKNRNLRTQSDLLLPKLISGEIDVSDIPMPT